MDQLQRQDQPSPQRNAPPPVAGGGGGGTMSGLPAGTGQSRLNSEPSHFTPPPPRSSVRKMVEVEPVVDARVERSCAVPGRPMPAGRPVWLTVVPLTPIDNDTPGEVAVLAHKAKFTGELGKMTL